MKKLKIGIIGDAHNHLSSVNQQIESSGADIILSVGDLGFYPDINLLDSLDPRIIVKAGEKHKFEQYDLTHPFFVKQVISVPGNHEDNEWLDDRYYKGICTVDKKLAFIHAAFYPLGMNHVFVFGFGKIHVDSTISTYDHDFLNDYGHRNNRKAYKKWIRRRNHFTKSDIDQAIDQITQFNKTRNWKKDTVIFISHDAPPFFDEEKGFVVGSSIIRDMVQLLSPTKAFFGHHSKPRVLDDISEIVGEHTIKIMEIKDESVSSTSSYRKESKVRDKTKTDKVRKKDSSKSKKRSGNSG